MSKPPQFEQTKLLRVIIAFLKLCIYLIIAFSMYAFFGHPDFPDQNANGTLLGIIGLSYCLVVGRSIYALTNGRRWGFYGLILGLSPILVISIVHVGLGAFLIVLGGIIVICSQVLPQYDRLT